MSETLVINESLSGLAPAVILGIVIISVMIYIMLTMTSEANECRKMRHIQKLIEEGSEKARRGSKNDGIYREKKQLKQEYSESTDKQSFYEDVEKWTKEAANIAQHDLDLLK